MQLTHLGRQSDIIAMVHGSDKVGLLTYVANLNVNRFSLQVTDLLLFWRFLTLHFSTYEKSPYKRRNIALYPPQSNCSFWFRIRWAMTEWLDTLTRFSNLHFLYIQKSTEYTLRDRIIKFMSVMVHGRFLDTTLKLHI